MLVQMLNCFLPKQKEVPLTIVNVFYCQHLTDAFVKYLVDTFPSITDLNLGRCPLLTTKSFDLLGRMRHLKKLNMVSASFRIDDVNFR